MLRARGSAPADSRIAGGPRRQRRRHRRRHARRPPPSPPRLARMDSPLARAADPIAALDQHGAMVPRLTGRPGRPRAASASTPSHPRPRGVALRHQLQRLNHPMLHPIHQIRRGDHPVRLSLRDRVAGSPSPSQGVRPPIPLPSVPGKATSLRLLPIQVGLDPANLGNAGRRRLRRPSPQIPVREV